MSFADKKITVRYNGELISAEAGLTLSEIVGGEKPCGGHGKCGKCKVVARGNISAPCDSELKHLSKDELEKGIRLACLTYALGDCEVSDIAAADTAQIMTDGVLGTFNISPDFKEYGVAIDIGTTTIASQLYDKAGKLLAVAVCLNPQSEWGADVISRIEAALDGKADQLAEAVKGAIDKLVDELAESAAVDKTKIDSAVITGNTVMLCLLASESVEPLSHAPFEAKRLFGETLRASELGFSSLKGDAEVYLPPCMAAFVGADTTCAVIATRLCDGERALMVDIGTNGEMALWSGDSLSVCSTAAGPAFEGVGISMGMRGAEGAIDKVSIVGEKLAAHVIGDGTPVGICGSGLIDAVACLLDLEEIDETGAMDDDVCVISAPVELTQDDIRMVQLAKSAICAGMQTLADSGKMTLSDVGTVYVAGGFGNYLNMNNAEKVGLLPSGIAKKTETVGNAALGGAAMLLLAPSLRGECESIAKNVEVIELSTNKLFSDLYIEGMFF